MNLEPSVCIIILNWNGWRNTLSCLESLDQLEFGNYRILVIDNGSSDDSVERLLQARPGLRLLQTGRNLGFGGGCNVGIRVALDQKEDYIWLLNNDTKVCAHALSTMVESAESDKRIGGVGSVIYWMDRPAELQCRGGGKFNRLIGRPTRALHVSDDAEIDFICGASLLMPARAVLDVGGFDDDTFFLYAEDVDLCLRLKIRGWRLAVATASTVRHWGNASLGRNSPLLSYYNSKSILLLSWKYSPLPLLTAFLVALRITVRYCLAFEITNLLASLSGVRDALRQIRLGEREMQRGNLDHGKRSWR